MSGHASNPYSIGTDSNKCHGPSPQSSANNHATTSETKGIHQEEYAKRKQIFEPNNTRDEPTVSGQMTSIINQQQQQDQRQNQTQHTMIGFEVVEMQVAAGPNDPPEQQKPSVHSYGYPGQTGSNKFINYASPSYIPMHPQSIQIICVRPTPVLLGKFQDTRCSMPFYINGKSIQQWMKTPTEKDWSWGDPRYVDLPFSSRFVKIKTDNHQRQNVPRWSIIEECLAEQKTSIFTPSSLKWAIKNTICKYNDTLAKGCDFRILDDDELCRILAKTLPLIIDRCLELPRLLATPLPMLRRGHWHTMYLTRQLCCSLLANAFLCTVPHNSSRDPDVLPHFHFLRLFHDGGEGRDQVKVKVEKIKCVLEYFRQVSVAVETGNRDELESIISFERRSISQKVNWTKSDKRLCDLHVNIKDSIEDAEGALQADFANKYIGGGILSRGMVQEEIRFSCCPDLIVSRLITEVLGNDDVLVVTGARFFNSYKGYRTSFRQQTIKNPTSLSRDNYGREMVQLVAMDALKFNSGSESFQYEKQKMDRELHKAFVAFYKGQNTHEAHIATGNWGCGAFNGDPQFKLLLQWIAASEAGRETMVFYTLGDEGFTRKVKEIVQILKGKNKTVSNLYKILENYDTKRGRMSVFEFVKQNV